jgi:hypothetical protein
MKDLIIELIRKEGNLSVTAIPNRIEGAKGDFDFNFPAKGIENSNILLVSGVSEPFVKALVELINDKILTFEMCSVFTVSFDGGDIYKLPIVNSDKMEYKTLHWLPLLIKQGVNFK